MHRASITENALFVIDVDAVNFHNLKADDMGSWNNTGTKKSDLQELRESLINDLVQIRQTRPQQLNIVMRMQVQACNYTSVKVVTLITIIKQDALTTKMKSTDQLLTSIVDENDRSLMQRISSRSQRSTQLDYRRDEPLPFKFKETNLGTLQRSLVHKIEERSHWRRFSMQLPHLPNCNYGNSHGRSMLATRLTSSSHNSVNIAFQKLQSRFLCGGMVIV